MSFESFDYGGPTPTRGDLYLVIAISVALGLASWALFALFG